MVFAISAVVSAMIAADPIVWCSIPKLRTKELLGLSKAIFQVKFSKMSIDINIWATYNISYVWLTK